MAPRSAVPVLVLLLGALVAMLGSSSCASGADGNPSLQAGDDAAPAVVEAGAPACNADLKTDPRNCGACGKQCTSSETCIGGYCASLCPGQKTMCPGGGCVDLTSDLANCGGCGAVCSAPDAGHPKAACIGGQCSFDCSDPALHACPDGCWDLNTSLANCGSCGNACASGQTCQGGVCCGSPSKVCGGACVDVTQDPSNCGSCGHACATGAHCAAGACVGYTTSSATTPFVDACTLAGQKTLLKSAVGWEESASVPLPFDVTFFGAKQTQFWIGSQGTLGLGASPAALGYPSCPLPDTTHAYPAIVAFGDSLDTSASGVCYATTGTAPQRQLVVTWEKATHESDLGSVLTFSVIVSESTGAIDVVYQTATAGTGGGGYVRGSSATVGLQGPTGASAAQFACGQGSNDLYNATPFAVRFTPM